MSSELYMLPRGSQEKTDELIEETSSWEEMTSHTCLLRIRPGKSRPCRCRFPIQVPRLEPTAN